MCVSRRARPGRRAWHGLAPRRRPERIPGRGQRGWPGAPAGLPAGNRALRSSAGRRASPRPCRAGPAPRVGEGGAASFQRWRRHSSATLRTSLPPRTGPLLRRGSDRRPHAALSSQAAPGDASSVGCARASPSLAARAVVPRPRGAEGPEPGPAGASEVRGRGRHVPGGREAPRGGAGRVSEESAGAGGSGRRRESLRAGLGAVAAIPARARARLPRVACRAALRGLESGSRTQRRLSPLALSRWDVAPTLRGQGTRPLPAASRPSAVRAKRPGDGLAGFIARREGAPRVAHPGKGLAGATACRALCAMPAGEGAGRAALPEVGASRGTWETCVPAAAGERARVIWGKEVGSESLTLVVNANPRLFPKWRGK